MPGMVGVPHGAWVDVDEETGIDMALAPTTIWIGSEYGGMGVSGYNNPLLSATLALRLAATAISGCWSANSEPRKRKSRSHERWISF